MSLKRRLTSVTKVGNIEIGGKNPVRIQSMATTDTNDTEASVAQAKRIIDAGGELVRFTTQGIREAENMKNISAALKADGYDAPLVADVHFTAHTADVAAKYCEKVRINPGNYVDPGRTFKHLEYTDDEYADELKKIERKLVPFLNICKERHTAVRIGVNHGSLSDRIMSRYGDTPAGIVESCMEFLRICRCEKFNDIVISIKASNTVVMVTTVRLLVQTMDKEGMHYPLHLGVTEAGEGEDGRIKSAVGIGALLTEGIGDTIRVSLSEEPEAEIPVARRLVELIPECTELRRNAVIEYGTLYLDLNASTWEDLQLKAAMAAGAILIDKRAGDLRISCKIENGTQAVPTAEQLTSLQDSILQAARIKFTKTEYISCPGCGRTLYDLRSTIARIKEATKGMVGVKIGIMGCIVNGPGEMADADYGYVGAGRGKISLYKNKECVMKNIPEEEAVDRLLELIAADRKTD
ncbi:(E)-4-hydroxy-3-methylbut-2-enyl-diphosphate synthase [Prevotella sp. OH937_COT-195]|uniref:(E)-4-hydroxy-3-methylbut-2-enyl-diphosphate synthase n=1 Tax=Prevotella sp. OH937_COT-195 TaxID=2491051 RepID=UPI000F64F5CF|nr:(E)-4-hydroxy-3-methylbut-2-enyl-diphosphate synthase [Prevotella sp. OH937_COT-195]RRC99884.1 4-hydroxy-3-methylbut-2-en-1-yl diphosphate synthase [Prevotella sp. OH937_COT-195]